MDVQPWPNPTTIHNPQPIAFEIGLFMGLLMGLLIGACVSPHSRHGVMKNWFKTWAEQKSTAELLAIHWFLGDVYNSTTKISSYKFEIRAFATGGGVASKFGLGCRTTRLVTATCGPTIRKFGAAGIRKNAWNPLAPKLRELPWRTVFGPADVASTFFARRAVLRNFGQLETCQLEFTTSQLGKNKCQSHWCLLDLRMEKCSMWATFKAHIMTFHYTENRFLGILITPQSKIPYVTG